MIDAFEQLSKRFVKIKLQQMSNINHLASTISLYSSSILLTSHCPYD